MFADFERDALPAVLTCDLCIVGAGAAGIALALRFAGRREEVLVVESGGLAPDPATQDLCRGAVVGLPYRPLERSRFRVFGGTTTQWGGHSAPFSDLDFEARGWVPWSGWPIARRDLDPYYAEAHAPLALGPFDYGAPTAPEAAGRLLPLPGNGPFEHFTFRRALHPTRFADGHRATLARARNVRVLLHANATELETDATGRRVEGLRIASLGGRRARVGAGLFALALGGLETPRLLLNSDRATPGGVGNGRDLVGRFFMDHLAVNAGRMRGLSDATAAAYRRQPDAAGSALVIPGIAMAPRLQRAERLSHVCATLGPVNVVRARSRGFWAARMIARRLTGRRSPGALGAHLLDVGRDLGGLALALREEFDPSVYLWALAEQRPLAESRVRLGPGRDALGLRRLEVDWRVAPEDLHSVRRFAELFDRGLRRLGAGGVEIPEWLRAGDLAALRDERSGFAKFGSHHIGTTRMAGTPDRGVVDPDCRVFGVDNLYIASASVFPTGGCVNPTLTIVALALRLADHLQARLRESPRSTRPAAAWPTPAAPEPAPPPTNGDRWPVPAIAARAAGA